jgi:predicted nucleic acid-binding protein
MILYADTSALVKKYVREAGTDAVIELFNLNPVIGTALITHAEIASALAKAVRMAWVREDMAKLAWQDFLSQWPGYLRLPLSTGIVERASSLAWRHGLRAYDSIHLACAMVLGEMSGEPVRFACFDQRLQDAARREGLRIWPDIPTISTP